MMTYFLRSASVTGSKHFPSWLLEYLKGFAGLLSVCVTISVATLLLNFMADASKGYGCKKMYLSMHFDLSHTHVQTFQKKLLPGWRYS